MLKDFTVDKIVDAIGINETNTVLLHFWGEDDDRQQLHLFGYAIAKTGASSITLQQSRETNARLFNSRNKQLGDNYYRLFDMVDVVIDICMYQPVVPGKEMSPEGMALYREHMRKLFPLFAQKEKFVQIRIPTKANAADTLLSEDDFITRMEQAYDIDYNKLRSSCIQKIGELHSKKAITLLTGADHKLTFDLEGRSWLIDAGDGDFPCGEVYIAPNETLTNGTVYFDTLFLEDVGEFSKITLTVEDGRIIMSDQNSFNDFLSELPENGNVVCELGIGLNPNVTTLSGYTVLDEKMLGTVHLGIGMNVTFGGTNNSPVHMDLVHGGSCKLI